LYGDTVGVDVGTGLPSHRMEQARPWRPLLGEHALHIA
jgi:hypothetical protein